MCSQDALPLWKMTTKYEIPQHYIIAGKIFRMLGVKKTISDWYYPPSSYFVSKMIYMYKVFLSLLNHLFESSSLAIYIPHWRQTFLTARENFYNEKTLLWNNSKFQIYSNSLKSIRSWIHTHMSYDLTLLLINSTTFSENLHHPLPQSEEKLIQSQLISH